MGLKGKNQQTGDEALVFDQFAMLRRWHQDGVLACPFCDETLVKVREHKI